jgi:hypothetical protein
MIEALFASALFFDDFGHRDRAALRAFGWTLRDAPGHPGVPGATWSADGVSLVDDPDRPGNRLLRLTARTDGTPAGTQQAQLCHQRKVLEGTYAARVRFADEPASGADGDPVIQTFYAVAPLRFAYDPQFSELDWEYLANGGWGAPDTRLYAIAWQTVQVEPWDAHNAAREVPGSQAGWRTLLMQVHDGKSRWFVDGHEVAHHGGRNHPVVPMAISFNLWFSPGGLLPPSATPRVWVQDVDWVLHAAGRVLSPAQVDDAVAALRRRGVVQHDGVPAANPPLASLCSF